MFSAEVILGNLVDFSREQKERYDVEESHEPEHDVAESPDGGKGDHGAEEVHAHESKSVPEDRIKAE